MATKFYYLRDKKNRQVKDNGEHTRGNPIAIIATEVNVEEKTVRYAVASTHPTDHFVKARGRQIVKGRLEVTPIQLTALDSEAICSGHEITKAVMLDIVTSGKERSYTKTWRAAKSWLKEADTPKIVG